jgi:hypothetical protein
MLHQEKGRAHKNNNKKKSTICENLKDGNIEGIHGCQVFPWNKGEKKIIRNSFVKRNGTLFQENIDSFYFGWS